MMTGFLSDQAKIWHRDGLWPMEDFSCVWDGCSHFLGQGMQKLGQRASLVIPPQVP